MTGLNKSQRKLTIFRVARAIRLLVINLGENMTDYLKILGFFLVGVVLYTGQMGVLLSCLGSFCAYLITGGWRFTWVVLRTLPRDTVTGWYFLMFQLDVRRRLKQGHSICSIFKENLSKYPLKTAFIFEDQKWTFRDVDDYSNAVANYFYNQQYKKGDVVAVFSENRIEVIGIWLGLSKIGVVSALLNYNLRNEQLMHCITSSEAKAVIFDVEKCKSIKEILPNLSDQLALYSFGGSVFDIPSLNLDEIAATSSTCDPPPVPLQFKDKFMFIFTSGTTGLPKAAIVTHCRFYYISYGVHTFFGIRDDDVIYNPLPLYHMSGSIIGAGQSIISGSTVVVAKKFSASRFWEECIRYNCTKAQYIGEICRYLLAQPPRNTDTKHPVRFMFGNGLRPELWELFSERFNVPRFGEFYGATEGNCNVMNIFSKPGAVGFTSRILPWVYPITLIKVDEHTGEPLRDRRGVCVKVHPGERGELVGKIVMNDPVRHFDGYVNKMATNKKIVTNVFTKGDVAFRTGDILEMDELGYMYFRDRTGDTFRWKGENVSTMEVEGVISHILGHVDSVVYGVQVFNSEGRAGMVAIGCQPSDVDFVRFEKQLENALPSYARPVFVRFCSVINTTGTFKLCKVDLRAEGFNPNVISDPVYLFDRASGHYTQLSPSMYDKMAAGIMRI